MGWIQVSSSGLVLVNGSSSGSDSVEPVLGLALVLPNQSGTGSDSAERVWTGCRGGTPVILFGRGH